MEERFRLVEEWHSGDWNMAEASAALPPQRRLAGDGRCGDGGERAAPELGGAQDSGPAKA